MDEWKKQEKGKRTRSINYTYREKYLLLNIVEKFKHIIESKQTDAHTWKDKEMAWEKICQIFNSQSPESQYRSKESLKKYFINIKKNVRKEVANLKQTLYRTGGGIDYSDSKKDPTFDIALDLMNKKTVFGLQNPYDGDSMHDNHCNDVPEENEFSEVITDSYGSTENEGDFNSPTVDHSYCGNQSDPSLSDTTATNTNDKWTNLLQISGIPVTSREQNSKPSTPFVIETNPLSTQTNLKASWSNVTPSQLKQPISKQLRTDQNWKTRRRPSLQQQSSSKLADEYSALAKMKLEICKIQKDILITEREAKKQREEELFKLEKRKLLLDIEFKELQVRLLREKENIFI